MSLKKASTLLVSSEFPPQPGGIGKHAYDLALALHREDFDVQIISDSRSVDGKAEESFDATLDFKVQRINNYRFRPWMYFLRLIKILKALKTCDNVIATGKFSLWAVAFGSLFYSKRFVAVVHGTEVNLQKQWARKVVHMALKRFDSVVAVSQYTASLINYLKLNVVVIPNGLHLEDWVETSISEQMIPGNPALTTVGRISKRKGQERVIKHLPGLLETYPEAHYHCIGLADKAAACHSLAKQLGVTSKVHIHGSLSTEQLKQMLKGSAIVVMLSTIDFDGDVEGFGIALLEANALGIPVIGALGCGIEDAIQHGASGVLVNPDDQHAFVNAVDEILNHYEHYQLGAKQWATQHDWKQLVASYKNLLV